MSFTKMSAAVSSRARRIQLRINHSFLPPFTLHVLRLGKGQKGRLRSPVDGTPPLHQPLRDAGSKRTQGFALGLRELKMLVFSKHTNNRICWSWDMTSKKFKQFILIFLAGCCVTFFFFLTNDIILFIYVTI